MEENKQIDMSQVIDAIVPGTDKSMDELRREGTYEEEQNPFSEVAAEFAQETAAKTDEELKIENQPVDQQVEFVARFFHMYLPIFKQKLQKMNKKGLLRVIERLVEYPLGDKLTWAFKEEKDAFLIGDRLLEAKYAMFKYIINEEIQKAKEQVEGEKVNGKEA